MKLRKITKWYHATTLEATQSILECGYIMPNKDQMIFLAANREDAGFFLNARGHKQYTIFEIHRRDIDNRYLFVNPACKSMLSSVYKKPIPVTAKNCKTAVDDRDLTFGIPGVELFTKGNGKTGYDVDFDQFTKHLKNNLSANNFNQFESLIKAGKQIEAEEFLEANWQVA